MNLKNKGKTHKRTNSKAGNSNVPSNTGNQQIPEVIMQNAGNPNQLLSTGTMGINNRVATQLENNSASYANQNVQNNISKKFFEEIIKIKI